MTQKQSAPGKQPEGLENPFPFCPYLGLQDDMQTAISYPSSLNHCIHTKPIEAVSPDYQRMVCLTRNFKECPVYQKDNLESLPHALRTTNQKWKPGKTLISVFIFLGILMIGLVAGILMGVIHIPGVSPELPLTKAPTAMVVSATLEKTQLPTPTATKQTHLQPMATQPAVTPLVGEPHQLEKIFGDDPKLVIHRVQEGEGFIWLAQTYNTSVEAIKTLNYNLPPNLILGKVIVIPVDTSNLGGLPPLTAYEIDKSGITIEKISALMKVDVELMKRLNFFPSGYELNIGEWILVPH